MNDKIKVYIIHYLKIILPTFLMMIGVVVTFISLKTFKVDDLSIFYHAMQGNCQNGLGYLGSSIAALLIYFFGSMAYMIPLLFAYAALFTLRLQSFHEEIDRVIGVGISFLVGCILCSYHQIGSFNFSGYGGLIGFWGMKSLIYFDHKAQAVILYSIIFAASILVVRFMHLRLASMCFKGLKIFFSYVMQIDNLPAQLVRALATGIAWLVIAINHALVWLYNLVKQTFHPKSQESIMQFEREDKKLDLEVDQILRMLQDSNAVKGVHIDLPEEVKKISDSQVSISAGIEVVESQESLKKQYFLPDIEKLLAHGVHIKVTEASGQELVEQAAILEEKLQLFGVKGKVVRIHPGPVITLFEYKPNNSVKLSKIIGLEDDLAMALQALSIRIIAPIPGKDVVGFEVSNKNRKPVLLSDIFHSVAWTKFKGSLPLILGEDTGGNHVVVDLASMPHLLIAGSTGSGKSVALNCMLVSLLCAKKPENLKLIIIDPKQIEFTSYEHVAHLLFPIVNDPKKALPILKWLVMTMEQRYDKMAEVGVKNIFEYHKLEEQRNDLEHMPFIVLMIDELADLMMTTGKEIEGFIARIAQMSRAAGIHMIVATQRPSVDVITGLIKVNFPNRISFKVTSKVDSRTILDEVGAERLLGKGDMLFIDAKDPHIKRVHGAYVSDDQIGYLVRHIESQQTVKFLDISDFFAQEQVDDTLYETDQDLYQQVVDMLKEYDEVSISMIQRRFRIGFNRSARIIETLEARGLIMANDGGKMRKVIKDS
jgi:S-DNA-T family DNA segregation ATPase FtsK/SpoIIIE